jgi:serine/threonine protein kinase
VSDRLSAVQPTAPIEPALIAGRYRTQRVLAEGGMGTVYSVADERSGETLALKRMRAPVAAELVGLFEREYRTLARIQHPRIIRVYDDGVDGSQPFYTMELVQGRDVHELAPVPYAEACRYLRDVDTCLALLHTRRLVHRDVTPRNVRVTPDGHCKLLDFGALTSFGIPDRAVGTPPCMPPEALYGAPLDQRADLFALGALAYFMLTKCHAYAARELRELPSVWSKRPVPPSRHVSGIPKQLDTLILGLLSLDPAARPSSAAEVVERLNALATLPAEDDETQRRLAESYFVHPQFVGRGAVLTLLQEHLTQLKQQHGGLVLLEAESGLGRTRLLGELVLQAQLAGIASASAESTALGAALPS